MEAQAPSFERDIRPLFRSKDVEAMSGAFDLSSYEDVRTNAQRIYERLANGSMPCEGHGRLTRSSASALGRRRHPDLSADARER